jgi:hypothetical protein
MFGSKPAQAFRFDLCSYDLGHRILGTAIDLDGKRQLVRDGSTGTGEVADVAQMSLAT